MKGLGRGGVQGVQGGNIRGGQGWRLGNRALYRLQSGRFGTSVLLELLELLELLPP
jgi:hypothetical protein